MDKNQGIIYKNLFFIVELFDDKLSLYKRMYLLYYYIFISIYPQKLKNKNLFIILSLTENLFMGIYTPLPSLEITFEKKSYNIIKLFFDTNIIIKINDIIILIESENLGIKT